MTEEERNMLILQVNLITGWTMELLNSLSDDELIKLHKERVANREGRPMAKRN